MLKENIAKALAKSKKTVILGVGSELRGDDAAGMLLIQLLKAREKDLPNVLLLAGSTAPENFTGQIKSFKPDLLIIADAAHLQKDPGTVSEINPEQIGGVSFSTHMLPFSILLQYLKNEINCDLLVLGIQPKTTEFGVGMTEAVETAVGSLAEDLYEGFKKTLMNNE